MDTLLTAVDCASAALMAAATTRDEDDSDASAWNDVVFYLQLGALFGEIVLRLPYRTCARVGAATVTPFLTIRT